MAGKGISVVEDKVSGRLNQMINSLGFKRQYLQTRALPKYFKAQRQRFITENATQGTRWEPLNDVYAAYKKKKFADFPGGGRKMMIATGRLMQSLTSAESPDFRKLVTDSALIVSTAVEYAKYPAETRPIMEFNQAFVDDIKADYKQWLLKSGKK